MATHDDKTLPSARPKEWFEASATESFAPNERLAAAQAVADECLQRRHAGEAISDAQLITAHPELMPELGDALAALALIKNTPDFSATLESSPTAATAKLEAELFGQPTQRQVEGYQILNEIHRGGQGVVYRAMQTSTQRIVALKIMLEGPGSSTQAKARFEREVQLIARLQHPGIVVIHDSGITRGQYYYAMEYIDGQPLDRYLKVHDLPLRQRVELVAQVCDAVAYAHQKGVIHRDLKPANILVTAAGKPIVVDFGLAKMNEDDAPLSHHTLTQSGHILGTFKYMSPEQTQGDHNALDVRSDVYTLGVILYEVIAGKFPYPVGSDIAELFRHIRLTDPPRPSRADGVRTHVVGSELDAITLKAMEKEHRRRYQSCAALSDDLRSWLRGDTVQARSASAIYVARKMVTRQPIISGSLALILLIAASCGAMIYHLYELNRTDQRTLQQTTTKFAEYSQGFDAAAALAKAQELGGEAVLGWFLAAWSDGLDERAQDIHRLASNRFPAYGLIMQYLLEEGDEALLQDQRLNGIPGLREFARGVHYAAENEWTSARQAFDACLAAQPADWLRMEAASRRNRVAASIAEALREAGS